MAFTDNAGRGRGAVKPLVERLRQTETSSTGLATPRHKGSSSSSSSSSGSAALKKTKLEKQREWNRTYVQWLKRCPGVVSEGGGNTITRPDQLTMRQSKLLNPTQRVTLAEWSLLLQTEELERSKRMLLEEREKFRNRIDAMDRAPPTQWSSSSPLSAVADIPSSSSLTSSSSSSSSSSRIMGGSSHRASPGNDSVTSQASRVSSLLSSDPGMSVAPASWSEHSREEQQHLDDDLVGSDQLDGDLMDDGMDDDGEGDLARDLRRMAHVEENDEVVGDNALMAVRSMLARMKRVDEQARVERERQEEEEGEEEEEEREERELDMEDVEEVEEASRFISGFKSQLINDQENDEMQQQQQPTSSKLFSSSSVAMSSEASSPAASSTTSPKRMLLWKKIFDSNSGHNYYYNRATGASVWVRPTDFSTSFVPEHLAARLQGAM